MSMELHVIHMFHGKDFCPIQHGFIHDAATRPMTFAELAPLAHDSASLSVGECLERECMLLADDDGTRYFVSSEPLDELLCIWASHRIPGHFAIVHTHPTDLKTLLSRLEAR
jgi:general secretion pathway protein E